MTTRRSLALLSLCTLLFSCKAKKEELLPGKWKATAIENPEMERIVREQQEFIDTVGRQSGPEVAVAYGFSNVEELKKALVADLEQFKAAKQEELNKTWFEFRKDGVAMIDFGSGTDSANWYFDEDGALILDEMKLKGSGSKLVMQVDTLTSERLQLGYDEDGVRSTVKFEKEK